MTFNKQEQIVFYLVDEEGDKKEQRPVVEVKVDEDEVKAEEPHPIPLRVDPAGLPHLF